MGSEQRCIFENPEALEGSRRKIDCGSNRFDEIFRGTRSFNMCSDAAAGPSGPGRKTSSHQAKANSSSARSGSGSEPSCRRRLSLDNLVPSSASSPSKAAHSDCTSPISHSREDFLEFDFKNQEPGRESGSSSRALSTPISQYLNSPTSGSESGTPSLKSLDDLEHKIPDEIDSLQLEPYDWNDDTSHPEFVVGGGGGGGGGSSSFSVYPGWSLWNGQQSPSKSFGGFMSSAFNAGTKSGQHRRLSSVSSAPECEVFVEREPSPSPSLAAGATRRSLEPAFNKKASRKKSPTRKYSAASDQAEECERSGGRRSWEAVSIIKNGFRSLASSTSSKSLSVDAGRHHQPTIRKRRKSCVNGYLQCVTKQGSLSYSFWMDDSDDVFIGKIEDVCGGKHFRFYTCNVKEKGSWKHWKKSEKPAVTVVGSMNFSSAVCAEVDPKGGILHYVDSEFCLMAIAEDDEDEEEEEEEEHEKVMKELAAIVIRVPMQKKGNMKTKKPSSSSSSSSSSEIWGTERLTVVLPAGNHGQPRYGVEGPPPLVERWRSGGSCDCGSWDLGCGLIILTKDQTPATDSRWHHLASYSKQQQHLQQPLNILLEGKKQKVVVMSLVACQDGLYRISYHSPMDCLQAFATGVAVLHTKIRPGVVATTSTVTATTSVKSSNKSSLQRQKKLSSALDACGGHQDKKSSAMRGRTPNPPLSPIHRL